MIRAYRMLSERVPYPLHLGVTEAGTPAPARSRAPSASGACSWTGSAIRSAISLTADPVEEVKVAWEILKALGLRERGPDHDRVPLLRPRQRRRLEPRRGGRGAAARVSAGVRGRRHGLRGRTGPARPATPTSGSRAGATPASSTRTGACSGRSSLTPRRGALPRDRPLDRGRHGSAEAPEAGQAGGPPDGRSGPAASRLATSWPAAHARWATSPCQLIAARASTALQLPDAYGRATSGRSRGGEPPAARPRRLHPAGERRAVVRSCRSAGASTRRPCRSSARRSTRSAARRCSCPSLTPAELWQATRPRTRSPSSSRWRTAWAAPFVLPMTHEETFTFHAREIRLPAAAADPLPLPDEGPRRAAPARRPDPRARVHHEGLVLVRPRRGGARA